MSTDFISLKCDMLPRDISVTIDTKFEYDLTIGRRSEYIIIAFNPSALLTFRRNFEHKSNQLISLKFLCTRALPHVGSLSSLGYR